MLDPANPVPGIGIYTGLVGEYPNVVFQIIEGEEGGLTLSVLRRALSRPWWFNVESGFFETFVNADRLSRDVIAGLGLVGVTAGVNITSPVTRADVTYKGIPVSG